MITSFRSAQTLFQRIWLCFHYGSLNALLIVLLYGFNGVLLESSRSYHGVSNFRSWLLFIGVGLTFSGFFVVIGYAKDDALFAVACSHGFDRASHITTKTSTELAEISVTVERREALAIPRHTTQKCQQIFRALLSTYLLLWTLVQIILLALFVCIDRYKKTRFQRERKEEREKRRLELAERITQTSREFEPRSIITTGQSRNNGVCQHCGHCSGDAIQKNSQNAESTTDLCQKPQRRVTFDEASLHRKESRQSSGSIYSTFRKSRKGLRTSVSRDGEQKDAQTCLLIESTADSRLTSGQLGDQWQNVPLEEKGGQDSASINRAMTMGPVSCKLPDTSSSHTTPTAQEFPMPPRRTYDPSNRVTMAAEDFERLSLLVAETRGPANCPAEHEHGSFEAESRLAGEAEQEVNDASVNICTKCQRRKSQHRASHCKRTGRTQEQTLPEVYLVRTEEDAAPQLQLSFLSLDDELVDA